MTYISVEFVYISKPLAYFYKEELTFNELTFVIVLEKQLKLAHYFN